MKIVLLERVQKLGQMGDIVDVKSGYARNFLLPFHKALRATEQNIPANTFIEFARFYGFQEDFQRAIRKGDKFQGMYEIFLEE